MSAMAQNHEQTEIERRTQHNTDNAQSTVKQERERRYRRVHYVNATTNTNLQDNSNAEDKQEQLQL